MGTLDVAIKPKCHGCSSAQIYTQNDDLAACCKGLLKTKNNDQSEKNKFIRRNKMWTVFEFT
jgi:hypothetical protein